MSGTMDAATAVANDLRVVIVDGLDTAHGIIDALIQQNKAAKELLNSNPSSAEIAALASNLEETERIAVEGFNGLKTISDQIKAQITPPVTVDPATTAPVSTEVSPEPGITTDPAAPVPLPEQPVTLPDDSAAIPSPATSETPAPNAEGSGSSSGSNSDGDPELPPAD